MTGLKAQALSLQSSTQETGQELTPGALSSFSPHHQESSAGSG